ncbi:MAG: hypothetical protein AB7I48_24340, partial [Planctomycetaceae bacterium]
MQKAHGHLLASGRISRESEGTQRIIALKKTGVRWQASIGVTSLEFERIRAGQKVTANGREHVASAQGLTFVRKSRLNEIAITALGADHQTEVSIAAMKGQSMTIPTELTGQQTPEDIRAAERTRIKAIETACDGIGGGCEREVQQLRAQAIDGTITMEQLTARLLDVSKLHALRASRNAGIGGFQPLSSGSSAFDVTQQTIECALCLKAGREDVAKSYGDDVRNRADGLRKKSLFELQNLLFAAHGMPTFDN